jgi:hypothetical protein
MLERAPNQNSAASAFYMSIDAMPNMNVAGTKKSIPLVSELVGHFCLPPLPLCFHSPLYTNTLNMFQLNVSLSAVSRKQKAVLALFRPISNSFACNYIGQH